MVRIYSWPRHQEESWGWQCATGRAHSERRDRPVQSWGVGQFLQFWPGHVWSDFHVQSYLLVALVRHRARARFCAVAAPDSWSAPESRWPPVGCSCWSIPDVLGKARPWNSRDRIRTAWHEIRPLPLQETTRPLRRPPCREFDESLERLVRRPGRARWNAQNLPHGCPPRSPPSRRAGSSARALPRVTGDRIHSFAWQNVIQKNLENSEKFFLFVVSLVNNFICRPFIWGLIIEF